MSVNNVTALFDQWLATSTLSVKQQAVLKASLKLFAAQGFARTSTSDIARAAGVSEGTVYKTFKTKTELLQAILAPFVQQVVPQMAGEFAQAALSDPPAEFGTLLRRILTDRLAFIAANGQVLKIIIGEVLQREELVAKVKAALLAAVFEPMKPLIAHYQAAGQLVAWPPLEIVSMIAGTLIGVLLPAFVQGQPLAVSDAKVDQAVAFLVKGLTPTD